MCGECVCECEKEVAIRSGDGRMEVEDKVGQNSLVRNSQVSGGHPGTWQGRAEFQLMSVEPEATLGG